MPVRRKISTKSGVKGLKKVRVRGKMARQKNLKIYLDDVRVPPKGWRRTYTPAQTIWHLRRQAVAVMSLDFDLGYGVPSGIAVLNWLEERVVNDPGFRVPRIFIHSANPAGVAMMQAAARNIYRLKREYGNR